MSEALKRLAGETAAAQVRPGMAVGLGHGSTAIWAVRRLAQRFAAGELPGLACVPCSLAVQDEAGGLGLPLTTLQDRPDLDLTIDGADEIDPRLDCIKGRGGAMLREKVVAQASARLVIVADASKLSPRLGAGSRLPVEVLPFALGPVARFLDGLGLAPQRRAGATDQGNAILDCALPPDTDAAELARRLEGRAGILGHGLFLGLAAEVLVAGQDGLRRLVREGQDA